MSRNYHENRTRVALLFDTLVDKLEHMKSNPEYGEYGEYGGLLDPGLANIILHKGMTIDLLEPDGNIYLYGILLHKDLRNYGVGLWSVLRMGVSFFCLGWEVPESLNGSCNGFDWII